MYQVKLTENFFTCPSAWRNFFTKSCQDDDIPNDTGAARIEYVNSKLKPWGGIYEYKAGCVNFETEKQMMFWILRWS